MLQRLRYRNGEVINLGDITGAVLLSKRDIENALNELEASGIIMVYDEREGIQLIE